MNAALRAAVIQEWRGLPEKKARPDHWETPGVLLPKLMQKLGLKERLRESEVIDAWSSIVGEFIAAHSAPIALRDETVSQHCDTSLWINVAADEADWADVGRTEVKPMTHMKPSVELLFRRRVSGRGPGNVIRSAGVAPICPGQLRKR